MILLQKFGPICKKNTWKCKRLVWYHSVIQISIRSLGNDIVIKINAVANTYNTYDIGSQS